MVRYSADGIDRGVSEIRKTTYHPLLSCKKMYNPGTSSSLNWGYSYAYQMYENIRELINGNKLFWNKN